MDFNTAKQTIADALNHAFQKGCYGIEDAIKISKAIETIYGVELLSEDQKKELLHKTQSNETSGNDK